MNICTDKNNQSTKINQQSVHFTFRFFSKYSEIQLTLLKKFSQQEFHKDDVFMKNSAVFQRILK